MKKVAEPPPSSASVQEGAKQLERMWEERRKSNTSEGKCAGKAVSFFGFGYEVTITTKEGLRLTGSFFRIKKDKGKIS